MLARLASHLLLISIVDQSRCVMSHDATTTDWDSLLSLPGDQLAHFFYSHQALARQCREDPSCPYQEEAASKGCFGYEGGCKERHRYRPPDCTGREGSREQFWQQADFGWLAAERERWLVLCSPRGDEAVASSLACTENMRFCRARNLYLDLDSLVNPPPDSGRRYYLRHRPDIFREGQVGGYCRLDKALFKQQNRHVADGLSLAQWYDQLEEFGELGEPLFDGDGVAASRCDVVVAEKVILQKMDVAVNFYHHMCDFLNLYLSLHMNGTSVHDRDWHWVMWDTSQARYGDPFADIYRAFTKHPAKLLRHYEGKRVCFKDVLFGYMARMRGGHFYNYYTVEGCQGAGLYYAFRDFLLHRLDIPTRKIRGDKVQVLLLSRSTKDRVIVNQDALVARAQAEIENVSINVVDFKPTSISITEQLKLVSASDILVGMHGAGLTHLLFLPDWGAALEVYDCGDQCYSALAKLRGVAYFTWRDTDLLTRHGDGTYDKMYNYTFDEDEFISLLSRAVHHVRTYQPHTPKYKNKEEL